MSGLRETAAAWHGGQWSALYAFASTGAVVPGLRREAEHCATLCARLAIRGPDEVDRLRAIAALEVVDICPDCGGFDTAPVGCRACCRDCGHPCGAEKDGEGFHADDASEEVERWLTEGDE